MNKDTISEMAREAAIKFYNRNRKIKALRIIDMNDRIIVCNCGNDKFKLYTSFGGEIYGKKNRLISFTNKTFNFVCSCGERIIVKDGEFSYAKVKYYCNISEFKRKCPENKTKMSKSCLDCKFCKER